MPDTTRLKQLKQRRDTLVIYLENEKKSKKKSDRYIEDLLCSIENCDKQIEWVKYNPTGAIVMVNGY